MTRIQFRRGTTSEWTSSTLVLAAGELAYNTTDGTFKIGDGTKTWSALSYADSGSRTPTQYSLTVGDGLTYSGSDTFNGSSAVTVSLPTVIARDISGTAAKATILATSRTINGTSFNGSAAVSVGGAVFGTTATAAGSGFRNIYVSPSASAPASPTNGDVWIAY